MNNLYYITPVYKQKLLTFFPYSMVDKGNLILRHPFKVIFLYDHRLTQSDHIKFQNIRIKLTLFSICINLFIYREKLTKSKISCYYTK